MPKNIVHEINRKIQKFLWNSSKNTHKSASLPWHVITKPKQEGGLGIKNTESMIKTFLMKHLWRLFIDEKSLWASVFKAKYFTHSSVLRATCKTSSSWAWKNIHKQLPLFSQAIKWSIGTGDKLFWKDLWLFGKPLIEIVDPTWHISDLNAQVKDVFLIVELGISIYFYKLFQAYSG